MGKGNTTYKNKKAYFDFELYDRYEAGIVLQGTEVKSVRAGKVSLNGAYCYVADNEMFIKDMDISKYDEASYNNHESKRDRKLLLKRKEIERIKKTIEEKGYTIVPLKMYENNRGIFKVEIATARGRKKKDKRDYIKDRETKKQAQEAMKRSL